jgi:hypothetical protein
MAHPGVEVICRDRTGLFADGAHTGAPGRGAGRRSVPPVAEPRQGRREVRRCHHTCLADPAPPSVADELGPALPEPEAAARPDPTGKYAERTQRHHALVHQLRAEGRACGRSPATWQELVDGRWKDHARASSIRSSPAWTSMPTVPVAASGACSARS